MDLHVVYHCPGSVYASAVAAAAHLGTLPVDRPPTMGELAGVPLFARGDERAGARGGRALLYMGTDGNGHKIYVLGRGREKTIVQRLLESVPRVMMLDGRCVVVAEPVDLGWEWLLSVAGFCLRNRLLASPARRVACYIVRRRYGEIALRVKSMAARIG